MLADKEFLESILAYIGRKLKHEANGMLIGGTMLYYGLKGQTKDLDLVFFKREDISGIVRIILSHPLYRKAKVLIKPALEIKPELLKKGKPTVIGDADLPKFDIFYRYVFSVDTKEFFEVSKQSIRFELLKLKLIDVENLVFLKAVSARPVDMEDITRIIKNLKIDWKKFIEVVRRYNKKDHRVIWYLLGTIYDLNKKEEIIPRFVVREVEKLFKE